MRFKSRTGVHRACALLNSTIMPDITVQLFVARYVPNRCNMQICETCTATYNVLQHNMCMHVRRFQPSKYSIDSIAPRELSEKSPMACIRRVGHRGEVLFTCCCGRALKEQWLSDSIKKITKKRRVIFN